MSERIVSPTERREKRTELQKQANQERANLEQAINEVAGTAAGLRLLQYIARATGHGSNPVVFKMESGMIMPMEGATLYNGARYSVYAEIREHLTPNNRMKVERNV